MRETEAITIHAAPSAAQIFRDTPTEQQRRIKALLGLRLSGLTQQTVPLQALMREISRNAQARGLTPELLDSLSEDI